MKFIPQVFPIPSPRVTAAPLDVRCARCGSFVRVFDLNGAVVDGERFVCGLHLVPVREPYDPATVPFPAGY